MRECPNCKTSYPDIHFRLRNDPVETCRVCRNRAANKVRDRAKAVLKRQLDLLNATGNRLKTVSATQLAKQRYKRIRERYNQLTGHTRRRIRDLESKVNPRPRTERALVARNQLHTKYYNAYMRQRALVAAGIQPLDIMEYV